MRLRSSREEETILGDRVAMTTLIEDLFSRNWSSGPTDMSDEVATPERNSVKLLCSCFVGKRERWCRARCR